MYIHESIMRINKHIQVFWLTYSLAPPKRQQHPTDIKPCQRPFNFHTTSGLLKNLCLSWKRTRGKEKALNWPVTQTRVHKFNWPHTYIYIKTKQTNNWTLPVVLYNPFLHHIVHGNPSSHALEHQHRLHFQQSSQWYPRTNPLTNSNDISFSGPKTSCNCIYRKHNNPSSFKTNWLQFKSKQTDYSWSSVLHVKVVWSGLYSASVCQTKQNTVE